VKVMANEMMRSFRFKVTLHKSPVVEEGTGKPSNTPGGTTLGDGGFQECTGLEIEMDIQDYLEGGRNDGVIRRAGRAKYSPLILKRGMFFSGGVANRELWEWIQGVVSGVRPIARYDGVVQVYDVGETVVATWVFDRGLPAKIRGPELNAKTGEISIEELQIAHEGLRLVDN
jgi:phage tail-like protein